jgi:glutaredoxin 3
MPDHPTGKEEEAKMLQLYQTEWCPFSHRVRAKLTELGVSYEAIGVPAEGEERTEVKELTGNTAIPVLVDGEEVISDSADIISYLEQNYAAVKSEEDARLQREELSPTISNTTSLPFSEALERIQEALQGAGLKLLGELDLAAELNRDAPLTVLVAMEQEFAERVAEINPGATSLGLLQIALYEQDGQIHVSAIKPENNVASVRNSEINSSGHKLQVRLMKLVESFNQES